MRWSKYAHIAFSIDRLLFASESNAKFIHGQVSFVEVRHGLDKRYFLFPNRRTDTYRAFPIVPALLACLLPSMYGVVLLLVALFLRQDSPSCLV